jgi:hypothetical protein
LEKKMTKNLSVVEQTPAATRNEPPGTLGRHGADLWHRITGAYDISDEGGREILYQACMAADRAENLREMIDKNGPLISVRGGCRENPLLKHELACRSFISRNLQRLGLNFEPLHATPGRPAGGIGWRP